MKTKLLFLSAILSHSLWAACLPVETYRLAGSYDRYTTQNRLRFFEGNLRKALVRFDDQLKTTPEIREGWHAYLKWDLWAESFIADSAWEIAQMKRVSSFFYDTEDGFNHPLFVAVRSALEDFLDFDEAVRPYGERLNEGFREHVTKLHAALAAPACDFAAIDAEVTWLANIGQATALVRAVRNAYSSANVVLRARKSLLDEPLKKMEKTQSDVQRSGNRIQGAWVVGNAYSNTRSRAEVIDTGSEARIRIYVEGTVHSPQSVATKGPATLVSSANSRLTAHSDVYWNGEEFAFTPPQATVQTSSQLRSVQAPPIIRRIAANQARKKRHLAEAEGSAIIKKQAIEKMRAEMIPAVAELNSQASDILVLMRKTGTFPAGLRSALVGDFIQIGFVPDSASGLGAPARAFTPLRKNEEFGISVHDTALGKFVRRTLGGARWTDVQFAQLQKELTGSNSEEFMIGLDQDRWKADWDWNHPVRVEFSALGATFRYRFSQLNLNGTEHETPFEVRSTFAVKPTSLGIEFERTSEVKVDSLDPQKPLSADVENLVARKFRGLFEDTFYLDGIQFPQGGDLDALSKYELADVQLEDHWMHMVVRKQ